MYHFLVFNALSTNITKWSNTLKQFVGKLTTNCLSVFDHFVGLALKGLKYLITIKITYFYEKEPTLIGTYYYFEPTELHSYILFIKYFYDTLLKLGIPRNIYTMKPNQVLVNVQKTDCRKERAY